MNVLSLFAGAGGMDVGVAKAGFQVVVASELDKDACATYEANHPDTLLYKGDVNENLEALCSSRGIDLVVGGPPCQGFSVAGKMDANDPRSKLVFTYCDVVERIRPKAFIMENVKALAALEKFQGVREEIFRRMFNAGYTVSMHVLNAKDFGVPQSRERVFFIGVQKGYKSVSESMFSSYKCKAKTLREAISHLGKAGSINNATVTRAKITLATNPIIRKSPYAGMLFNGQGRPLNPDAWSSTLPASMGGNRTPIIDEEHLYDLKESWVEHYHAKLLAGNSPELTDAPKRLRRLTLKEAAILQTFPENYKFLGPQSKIFSQIGNAVPCDLAYVVASVVRKVLLKDEIKTQISTLKNFELDFA